MSFFGDVFGFIGDVVSAPVDFARNATKKIPIAGPLTQALTGPMQSGNDILKGKNVGDSLVKGSIMDPLLGFGKIGNQVTFGYNSKLLNSVGLQGVSQLDKAADDYYNDRSTKYLLPAARGLGTAYVIAGAAYTGGTAGAAALGVSGTTGGAIGAGAALSATKGGNILGSLSSIGGQVLNNYIPSEYQDAFKDIKGYLPSGTNGGYSGTNYGTPLNPGGGDVVSDSVKSSNAQAFLLIGGVALVSYLAYKRIKK